MRTSEHWLTRSYIMAVATLLAEGWLRWFLAGWLLLVWLLWLAHYAREERVRERMFKRYPRPTNN